MKRVMLTVAYDGTRYNGWQVQPNGVTIEGELNSALTEFLGEEIRVSGASRTDAGVHALCNLAVFDTNARMPGEKMSYALNQRLPEDIKVLCSQEVPPAFHPRKCESRKTYVYRIYVAPFPNPLERTYALFTYVPLDVDAMKAAAAQFVGEHDFTSFSTSKPEITSSVRTVTMCEITEVEKPFGNMIEIRVQGNGFLYNMVRIMVGTLMEVGRGNLEAEAIAAIFEQKDRAVAGPTAPACGLMLENYTFFGENPVKIY